MNQSYTRVLPSTILCPCGVSRYGKGMTGSGMPASRSAASTVRLCAPSLMRQYHSFSITHVLDRSTAMDRARSRGALNDIFDGADNVKGTADDIDAILSPANFFAAAPAKAGYPSITVPMGEVHGLPVGLLFIGGAFAEAELLAIAYAYEQASHNRKAPSFRVSTLSDVSVPD